jgi:hypothetical protein
MQHGGAVVAPTTAPLLKEKMKSNEPTKQPDHRAIPTPPRDRAMSSPKDRPRARTEDVLPKSRIQQPASSNQS